MKNMVLVVSQFAADRDSVAPILGLFGFQTFNARTVNQALAFIDEHADNMAAVIVDGDTILFTEEVVNQWPTTHIPMIVRQRSSQIRRLPVGMRLPIANASKAVETAHMGAFIQGWHAPALKLAA